MSRPERSRPLWDHLRVSQLWLDLISRGAATIVGLFLLFVTTISLMRTVVIPRSLRSAISDTVATVVIKTAQLIARAPRSYRGRDSVLAWAGPTIIILQLVTWLVLYLFAYAFLIYGVGGHNYPDAMTQAGSSLFTLGFAASDNRDQTIVDFFAAATGPVVIALMIGFLPTIYSSYLEREVDVTMLGAMGGDPAWGPEFLARHALTENVDTLPETFARWSRWASALRMTHVTYPVLVWVRSARASRHYAVSLLAVLDAAALKVSLNTTLPRTQSFGLLLHGAQAFEVLYVILFLKRPWKTRIPLAGMFLGRPAGDFSRTRTTASWNERMLAVEIAADKDAARGLDGEAVAALVIGEAHELQITRADFDVAVDIIRRSGFPIDRDLDDAWTEFKVLRTRYEFAAYEICRALDATPAPWSGDRKVPTPTIWPSIAVNLLPDHGSGA